MRQRSTCRRSKARARSPRRTAARARGSRAALDQRHGAAGVCGPWPWPCLWHRRGHRPGHFPRPENVLGRPGVASPVRRPLTPAAARRPRTAVEGRAFGPAGGGPQRAAPAHTRAPRAARLPTDTVQAPAGRSSTRATTWRVLPLWERGDVPAGACSMVVNFTGRRARRRLSGPVMTDASGGAAGLAPRGARARGRGRGARRGAGGRGAQRPFDRLHLPLDLADDAHIGSRSAAAAPSGSRRRCAWPARRRRSGAPPRPPSAPALPSPGTGGVRASGPE